MARREGNPRQRKTRDVWVVQGNYGQGWEDVTTEETFKEIRQRAKEYRENEPQYAHRIRLTRERIETAANPSQLKYVVITSFGGKEVTDHRTLAEAKRQAKNWAKTTGIPVDVWTRKGGQFGKGKVVAHYAGNPGPSAIPTKWIPATVSRKGGQIQIRMGGR